MKCIQMVHLSQGIGSIRVPMNPVTASKLYWQAAVPKMTYGLDVLKTNRDTIARLEQSHCEAAKVIQGLPKQTAGIGCLATVGWNSMEAHIDILRLLFLWRLLTLPVMCIFKVVLLLRLHYHLFCGKDKLHSGPTWMMVTTCKKYGLLDYVANACRTGDGMTLVSWKRLVYSVVKKKDIQRWKVSCNFYSSLLMLNVHITCFRVIGWWVHVKFKPLSAWKVKILLKCLFNVDQLNVNVSKYTGGSENSRCRKCIDVVSENIKHVLFECPGNQEYRESEWKKVKDALLPNLFQSIECLAPSERTSFILNAFNCDYIQEWSQNYEVILNYIVNIYKFHTTVLS